MTENPNWVEIQDALLKELSVDRWRQEAVDWPDIVACVFQILLTVSMDYHAVQRHVKLDVKENCIAHPHLKSLKIISLLNTV